VTGHPEIRRLTGPLDQFFGDVMDNISVDAVMGPVSPFLSSHHTGPPQYLQVLGYGRFGDTQTTGQSAHAEIMGQ
jgi:hypothetical protein